MIDWSKYEKVGEFRDGKITWYSPNKENVVYCTKVLYWFYRESLQKNLHARKSHGYKKVKPTYAGGI